MRPLSSRSIAMALAGLTLPAEALTQAPAAPSPTVAAVHAERGAIRVDGRLDEPVWQLATPATGFIQRDPSDGEPASEQTEFRVAYTNEAIYFGIRAFDSRPGEIRGELSRRDRRSPSDEVGVLIDSYHDRRTAFEFTVNAAGSIRDVYRFNDSPGQSDDSWDPVWQVETAIDAEGWTAEIRIPVSQLRFDRSNPVWGLQVVRRVARLSEESYWAPYSKSAAGFASLFGTVTGLEGLPPARRIELRPYAASGVRRRPAATGQLYWPRDERRLDAGADLKIGLGPALTLDATVNPDFGQVEADPAVVNLTAYESFFPEKRPFFVEGGGLFSQNSPAGLMFYSRRIGRAPRGWASPPEGGTAERPDQTTILGAAKLTGKIGPNVGIGILSAVTAEESALLRDAGGAELSRAPIEPRTHYFAGRAERDLASGSHTIGLMTTAVNRSLDGVSASAPSAAYTAAADGVHRWRRNTFAVRWKIAATHVRGSTDVIAAIQRSPLHYFQRPDAEHLSVDTSRTSLSGTMLGIQAGKEAGRWRYGATYNRISPAVEMSDLGFQFTPGDRQRASGHVSMLQARPQGVFRNYRIGTDANASWTTGGERIETWVRPLLFSGALRNNTSFNFNPMAFRWGRSANALRGGPMLREDLWRNSFVNIGTDSRKPVIMRLWAAVGGRVGSNERWWFLGPELEVRPSSALNGSIELSYGWNRDPTQWVGRRVALGEPHYLLAEIESRNLSAGGRVNWTLTPELSLEAVVRPLVATGAYSRYKEVADPDAEEFSDRFRSLDGNLSCDEARRCTIDFDGNGTTDASFTRPDFNVRSLRSTAVLRWEYRPGSVLYLAWQHGRNSRGYDPAWSPDRDLRGLLDLPADNTLLLKVSYWFGM